MKKLCVLCALALMLAGLAAQAEMPWQAEMPMQAEIFECGDYSYALLGTGTAEIAWWNGEGAEADVPAELDGHAVSAVGAYAFAGAEWLEKVILPDGVTRVEDGAFADCEALKAVSMPETVCELGRNPFRGCAALTDLSLAGDAFRLESGALVEAETGRLVSLIGPMESGAYEVPEGVKIVGEAAFEGRADIMSIVLPEGVEAIGEDAFEGCEGLSAVALPESLAEIGDRAFAECRALTEIDVPAGVKSIGIEAFSGCDALETAALSEGLIGLGDQAFTDCASLRRIELPLSLEAIGLNPFMGCDSLAEIAVPEGHALLSLSDGVLLADGGRRLVCYPMALDAVRYAVPEGVERIDDYAFYCCARLLSVAVPEGVMEIGWSAFEGRGNLTLVVNRGSFAEGYAKEYMLKYAYPDSAAWLAE